MEGITNKKFHFSLNKSMPNNSIIQYTEKYEDAIVYSTKRKKKIYEWK